MFQIISKFLFPAIITIIVSYIPFAIFKSHKHDTCITTEGEFVIKLPKAYMWIGLLCVAVFSAFSYFAFFSGAHPATYCVFLLFVLLGLFIAWGYFVWKIELRNIDDYFRIRTISGRRYKIYYKDCMNYCFTNYWLQIKTKHRKFYVDINSNYDPLLHMLKKNHVKIQ